ncbi:hypothetical protein SBOR_10152 [Sclerotinia borealis F-4128]|uniref:Uncharacterized protein n=1 Tax=Sclerotinia borealis (strain F-4128) TaxID=1432307 RepID=W9C3G4_SCLBF|nr:hypothetical protein SBOR_10152 [Sclerotinia borealis F-4128]
MYNNGYSPHILASSIPQAALPSLSELCGDGVASTMAPAAFITNRTTVRSKHQKRLPPRVIRKIVSLPSLA